MLAKLVNIAYIIYIPPIYGKHLFVSKLVEQQSSPTVRKTHCRTEKCIMFIPIKTLLSTPPSYLVRSTGNSAGKKWGESVRGIGCKSIPEEAGKVGTHSRKVWLYTLPKTNIGLPKKWWFPIGIFFCRGRFPGDNVSLREGCQYNYDDLHLGCPKRPSIVR